MNKYVKILPLMLVATLISAGLFLATIKEAKAANEAPTLLDLGDSSSNYLLQKAWTSLTAKKYATAVAYADKVVELYAPRAHAMESTLMTYPSGTPEEIFQYWALNDVATALFIQGEAYRSTGQEVKAKEAFKKVVNEYLYAQCWDPRGWFWRPASVAQDRLDRVASGVGMDFGDYSSNQLVQKAWAALSANDLKNVTLYVNKLEELYGNKAREMQLALAQQEKAAEDNNPKIFNNWALNDVGTGLFILGEAYRNAGHPVEAQTTFQRLINEYSYAQCWDQQGWFWRPAEVAALTRMK